MLGIVIGVPPPRGKESTSPSSYSLSATSPVESSPIRPSSSPRRQPYERNKWPSTPHRSHPHDAALQAHHRRKPPPPPPFKSRYAVRTPIPQRTTPLTPSKATTTVLAQESQIPHGISAEERAKHLRIKIVHGIFMGSAFALLFPTGAIIMRMLKHRHTAWIHGAWQAMAYVVAIVGFGTGVWLAVTEHKVRFSMCFFVSSFCCPSRSTT